MRESVVPVLPELVDRSDRSARSAGVPPALPRSLGWVVWRLTKLPITALSTFSAVTGYLLMRRSIDPGAATLCLGVLLTGMGTCALNQVQDRKLDARMKRTRGRPIPSGAIHPVAALSVAALLMTGGFLALWLLHNLTAALLALLAAAWYNGAYAFLKRRSAFAILPGALVGALPPAIGWSAAGGNPADPRVLALCFVFFIWQVPHFWLLLFLFGDDYADAGLPSLTTVFTARQLAGLSFVWMLATSASALLLPIYRLTSSPWTAIALALCALWLAWTAAKLLATRGRAESVRPAFRTINLYALSIMTLLVTDALL